MSRVQESRYSKDGQRKQPKRQKENQEQWSSVVGLQHSFPPFSAKSTLTFLWGIHSSHILNPVVWILGERCWLVLLDPPDSLPTASQLFSVPATLIFLEFFKNHALWPSDLYLSGLLSFLIPLLYTLHLLTFPSRFRPLLKPFLTFPIRPGHPFTHSSVLSSSVHVLALCFMNAGTLWTTK